MNKVDARGLSCPQPVILTKKALEKCVFPLEILVETVTSCENVRRIAEKAGCQVSIEPVGDEFKLIITRK